MKLYIAIDEYQNVYSYTSKKRMLREANANEFEVQEPITFDLTKRGVLGAMHKLTHYCGNTADITLGD
tara:strand:+ start:1524 stop:1727 length:204 start_codon:yes stop_codon:yes gene_type:complete